MVVLWRLLAAAAVSIGGADDGEVRSPSPAERLVEADRVLVIAHRGDSKAYPENTLPAFESAVRIGADLVELDYVHTSDGVPVVIHDATLDRTTNAVELWGGKRIRVDSKTLADLGPLDAGAWFRPEFAGTRLPTLEAALDAIQAGSTTLIERKEGDAKTCVELLERKGLVGEVVVQAFDWNFLADCRKLRPDVVLGALGQGKLPPERLDAIEKCGATIVGWHFLSLRKEQIDAVHERGLKAWAWTVDDPKAALQLVEWGVDGIITNVPSLMKDVLERRAHPASVP